MQRKPHAFQPRMLGCLKLSNQHRKTVLKRSSYILSGGMEKCPIHVDIHCNVHHYDNLQVHYLNLDMFRVLFQ